MNVICIARVSTIVQDTYLQQKELIESSTTGGGKLFVNYLKDCSSKIFQFNTDGSGAKEVALPGIGTAGGLGGKKADQTMFYTYTSFNTPPVIYKYELNTGLSSIFRAPELKFKSEN